MMRSTQNSPAKTGIRTAILASLLTAGATPLESAQAVTLPSGATLSITTATCTAGSYVNGTCTSGGYVNGGSFFSMDLNANSKITSSEMTGIALGTTGLVIGQTSSPGSHHAGATVSGDASVITAGWLFNLSTGTNHLNVAATGNTTAGLDLSGWAVAWSGLSNIPMNAGAWQPSDGPYAPGNCAAMGCTGWSFTNSTAQFIWDGINGHSYTLNYAATVPAGDPSGFGGTKYFLHLIGTVTLPAFTLTNDNASTTTNTAKTIDVTANDSPSGYSIDNNSVAIASTPANGTLTLGAAGSSASGTNKIITYTPNTGFTGTNSFTYTVTGNNGITSSPATVTVTVSAVLPPTANNDPAATASGTTASTISVLSNDTPGANPINASTVAISTAASHGTATPNPSGTVTYTATSGFSGTDTFQYTVNDTAGNPSNAATVNVKVYATAPSSSTGTLSPGTTAAAAGGTSATTGGGLTTANVGTDSALTQQCVGGCFDFRVTGVTAGSSVRIVLPLSATIPAGAVYRKKSASGTWADFSTTSGNAIASATPISAGVCPEAGSTSYSSGLTTGNQCVQLTIVEGGANDADSVSTTVSDPSGVGVVTAAVDTRSGSTGGCSISSNPNLDTAWKRGDWWLVAGLIGWLGMIIRRRQNRA